MPATITCRLQIIYARNYKANTDYRTKLSGKQKHIITSREGSFLSISCSKLSFASSLHLPSSLMSPIPFGSIWFTFGLQSRTSKCKQNKKQIDYLMSNSRKLIEEREKREISKLNLQVIPVFNFNNIILAALRR